MTEQIITMIMGSLIGVLVVFIILYNTVTMYSSVTIEQAVSVALGPVILIVILTINVAQEMR